MAEFNVRSDSVNVEQIMQQIRERIRQKRGVDYTEEQIHELATVKLEKFLDSRGVRSDLLDQFKRTQVPYSPPDLPKYVFEDETIFETHRPVIRWLRRLLLPVLKLLFNPNPIIQALHIQADLNARSIERENRRETMRQGLDRLYYEVLHNLVIEMTRTSIEVKNLKMRVESLTGRLEFNERRARALERAVVYRPTDEEQPEPQASTAAPTAQPASGTGTTPAAVGTEGPGQRSRRRRRRRGRRGSGSAAAVLGGAPSAQADSEAGSALEEQHSSDWAAEDHDRSTTGETIERALGEAHPVEPSAAAAEFARPGGGSAQGTPSPDLPPHPTSDDEQ
jgi:hypothetical protein